MGLGDCFLSGRDDHFSGIGAVRCEFSEFGAIAPCGLLLKNGHKHYITVGGLDQFRADKIMCLLGSAALNLH
jgi:hypothetical protein